MSENDGGYAWATELGEGALKDAGVSLLGYGLSSLGIGFPNATDDAISKLQTELNLIENQIVALQNEMTNVQTAVSRDEFDTGVRVLGSIMDSISTISSNLHDALCVSKDSPNPPGLADLTNPAKAADKTEIIRQIEAANLVTQLSFIHDSVMGPAGGISLYQLLNNLLIAKHRFISRADCLMIQNLLDYYQNAQYTQLWLVVEYYRAKGTTDFIEHAIKTVRGNVYNEQEQFGVTPQIVEGTVVDPNSKLMFYVADNPYKDYDSARDFIFQLNVAMIGGQTGWRLPTVAELLGNDSTVGLFSGYDSKDGTPPQWLTKHGFPKDMTGIHFWTGDYIQPPNRSDYPNWWTSGEQYEADLATWKTTDPSYFYVDSANLGYFEAQASAQAHVVAVLPVDAAHAAPLCTSDYTPSNA